MTTPGMFCGIGVGPGQPGLIPVIAWEFLKRCEVIFVPRATTMEHSVARRCLPANDIPDERFREVEFMMAPDRDLLGEHYAALAKNIAAELRAGKDIAYLTIGDPFTYSTYTYTLAALKRCLPDLRHRTYPGVTSYCAVAAATEFPLGEGKERVLILPCPDELSELRAAIECHEIVVLMKIGKRLPGVIALLQEMGIAANCVFARRIGMDDEVICCDLHQLEPEKSLGYLATMLIRKSAAKERRAGVRS